MRTGFWKTLAACVPLLLAMGPAHAQRVDEDNGWNGNYISTVGADKSDFYAQAFIADVLKITKFGVVAGENSPQGEIRLAITEDDGTGHPNVAAPLYTGPLIDPTPTMAWFYETGVSIPVVPGRVYYVLIDGYQNPGATGTSRIGTSSVYPSSGAHMIYSNNGGSTWEGVGSPIAIYVEGVGGAGAVPTLSGWMLGLLAAALGAAGVWRLKA